MSYTCELFAGLAALILALKYQLVASAMQQYVRGQLDSVKHANKIKLFFILSMFISLIVYVFYCVMCARPNSDVIQLEFRFACAGIVLQVFLLLSYLKSMLEIECAVR
jgi:hypothetical protein